MRLFSTACCARIALAAALLAGAMPLLAARLPDRLDKQGQIVVIARWNDPQSYAKAWGDGDQFFQSLYTGRGHAQHPNLKSATLRYRAWATPVIRDLFSTAEFAWEMNEVVTGSTPRKTIAASKLEKYPSLLKRLQALRPRKVEALISVGLRSVRSPNMPSKEKSREETVYFRIAHGDLLIGPSRTMPVPAPPLWPSDWRTALSMDPDVRTRFTATDRSSIDALRSLVLDAEALTDVPGEQRVTLKIEWPLAEIDEIIELYEKYEREGKKIDDDFAALKPDFKPPAPPPYNKGGELAKPYEEEIKTAELFADKSQGVGLRAKGKEVMRSTAHYPGSKLGSDDRFFVFPLQGAGRLLQVFDARGKVVTLNGLDRFVHVAPGPRPGTYRLGMADFAGQPRLVTQKDYSSKGAPSVMSQAEFSSFSSRDGDGQCRTSGGRVGEVSFHTGYRRQLYRGRLLTVDSRFQLLSDEAGYFANGSPPSQVGRSICDGG